MVSMEVGHRRALFISQTSYPYRALSRKLFDMVLEMLSGRYADSRLRELKARVSLDRVDNTIQAHSEVPYLLYTSGGTIPERGYFDLRLTDTRAKIGELDEEFVWERSIGESFTLGTQLWRIEKITHNDVEVVPVRSAVGIFPFWKAEQQDRDYHFQKDRPLSRTWTDCATPRSGRNFRAIRWKLQRTGSSRSEAPERGDRQRAPHRHHLLIERGRTGRAELAGGPAPSGEAGEPAVQPLAGPGRRSRPLNSSRTTTRSC
jgi:ATP-dependent Lhr-like helicase